MAEYQNGYLTITTHLDLIEKFNKTNWQNFISKANPNSKTPSTSFNLSTLFVRGPEFYIIDLFNFFFSFKSDLQKDSNGFISETFHPNTTGLAWDTEQLHLICEFLISQGCGVLGYLEDNADCSIEYNSTYRSHLRESKRYIQILEKRYEELESTAEEYSRLKTILLNNPENPYTGKQLFALLALLPSEAK
jgi:hypothetical protein